MKNLAITQMPDKRSRSANSVMLYAVKHLIPFIMLLLTLAHCTPDKKTLIPATRIAIPIRFFTYIDDSLYYPDFGKFYKLWSIDSLQFKAGRSLKGYIDWNGKCTAGFNVYDVQSVYDIPQTIERSFIYCLRDEDPAVTVQYGKKDSLLIFTAQENLVRNTSAVYIGVK